ncbi:glycosyltransferase family 2 protein [Methanobrevibacter sp.]|uniref:glycosyltransferase family 2 protein n=1 Tax=Methanobrevibacter sp. TaxID=66852 RepID=UPI00388F15EA
MSDENPKVTVIMPSLNVADFIDECITSVTKQSLSDIEIICIDAGSTDGTLEILKSHASKDSRVSLIHSDRKSYGHQMNVAMSQARGEYIGIVETDDYVDSEMFEKLYSSNLNGKADVVKASFYHVYENGDMKKDRAKSGHVTENEAFSIEEFPAFIKGHPSIWAGIYRREFLEKNGITFIEEAGGGWVDNPFFYETAFAADSIVYMDDAYYYYREFNPTSSSNNLNDYTIPIRRMLDNLDVYDKYGKKSEGIAKMVHMRAFAYLNNIKRRDYFDENLPEVRPLLCEMMSRLDEEYIKKNYSADQQLEYYRYLSPLRLKSDFTDDEYEKLIKENDFLYEFISELQNKKTEKKPKETNNTKSSFKSRFRKIF